MPVTNNTTEPNGINDATPVLTRGDKLPYHSGKSALTLTQQRAERADSVEMIVNPLDPVHECYKVSCFWVARIFVLLCMISRIGKKSDWD